MKKITITLISLLLISITALQAQNTKVETLKVFLKEIISLEGQTIDKQLPLVSIGELAKVKASKFVELTKDNIAEQFVTAKAYQHSFIIVGNHTIAKITDFSNCSRSGVWGVCMPYGNGYVQKGTMIKKQGYLNSIIGVPDQQSRVLFMFNEK
ncbi:MAG: hypothetical protein JEZ03_10450 [Bacteroidales bacterium]|nr:hypothetical protein [Bacteroidales bacterium]